MDQQRDPDSGMRRGSTISLAVGIAAAILTILGSIIWRELRNNDLPAVIGIAGIGSAYGLILWSAVERLFRTSRSRQHETCVKVAEIAAALDTVVDRLTAIEAAIAKVPDYGQAILDGAEIGRQMAAGRD